MSLLSTTLVATLSALLSVGFFSMTEPTINAPVHRFENIQRPRSPDPWTDRGGQIGTVRFGLRPANILKLSDSHHTGGKNQVAGVRACPELVEGCQVLGVRG